MRLNATIGVGSPTLRFAYVGAVTAVLVLTIAAAVAAGATLLRGSTLAPSPPVDWSMGRGDASHRGEAADGPTGRPIVTWRYQAAGMVAVAVPVVGDLVYVPSDDGALHALDRSTGTERWSVTFDEPGATNAAVDDGRAYVRDGSGRFHALDATTGNERWRGVVAYDSPTGPTVAAGVVLFGTADGHLVALDAAIGAELWTYRASPDGLGVSSPAVADGLAYIVSGGTFAAVDVATGALRWRTEVGSEVAGTPVVADGIAYVGASSESTGPLLALDASSGRELWRIDEPLLSPAVSDGVAYSGSVSGLVTARDARTGKEWWRVQMPSIAWPPSVAAGSVYVPVNSDGVFALQADTGAQLWQQPIEGQVRCCVAVAHGHVFVGTDRGIVHAIGGDGIPIHPTTVETS